MVYVQNRLGQPLMPTKDHRKVRLLLDSGAAVVVKRTPFTIRLTTKVKTYVQPTLRQMSFPLGIRSIFCQDTTMKAGQARNGTPSLFHV